MGVWLRNSKGSLSRRARAPSQAHSFHGGTLTVGQEDANVGPCQPFISAHTHRWSSPAENQKVTRTKTTQDHFISNWTMFCTFPLQPQTTCIFSAVLFKQLRGVILCLQKRSTGRWWGRATRCRALPQRSTGIEIEARPDFSMPLDFTGSYCLAQCFLCAAETYSAPQVGAKLNVI